MSITQKVFVLFLVIQVVSIVKGMINYDTFTCPAASNIQPNPLNIPRKICSNIAVFDFSLTSAAGPFVLDDTIWYNYQWKPTASFGTLGTVSSDYTINNYTAQWLQFKSPSEHSLNSVRAPLELQIFLKNVNNFKQNAIFSFLLYRSMPPGQASSSNHTITFLENVADIHLLPTSVSIDFSRLSERVNKYPLFYRYPGTTFVNGCEQTIRYVYTSPIYVPNATITEIQDSITYLSSSNIVLIATDVTDPQTSVAIQSNSVRQSTISIDADLVERFCYKEFWRNHMPFNYGLWFALGMLVLYFCCQLCVGTSKPIRDPEYKESVLTIHPVYSLAKVSNDIFTRRTRFTVMWMNLTNNAIITAIFAANNKTLKGNNDGMIGADIFIYGIIGSAAGGLFTYIWGFFLRKFFVAKHRLLKEKSKGEESSAKQIEKHEEDANFYLYVFYFLAFAWMWGGNLIFVWQMNMINPIDRINVSGMQNLDMSKKWVAAFFISIGIDWLVLDVLHVILAFILPCYRHIAKWRGYMYDKVCHETWLLYSKDD